MVHTYQVTLLQVADRAVVRTVEFDLCYLFLYLCPTCSFI